MSDNSPQIRRLALCLICCGVTTGAFACNEPPIAAICSAWTPHEQSVCPNTVVRLDGSWSYDPDGWIYTYEWRRYKHNGSYYQYETSTQGSPVFWRCTSTGRYKWELWVEDDDYAWCDWPDTCYVDVVEVDIYGPEYLGVDDIRPVYLSMEPSLTTGILKLSKTVSGSGDIAVYYDQQGTDPVTLPKSWALWRGPFPTTLFVTGTAVSSAEGDVGLILQYDSSSGCVDSDAISYTVLNLQITEPDGDPVYDHEFCFTSTTPGTLSIPVTGTTGIPSLDANPNNLKWTLTDKQPLFGSSVTFEYDSMPSTNSGFGQKTLKLQYIPAGLEASKTTELFFPKTATNNLYEWQNWAYYWQSGPAAVSDLAGFVYISGQAASGEYFQETDTLVVYDRAAEAMQSEDLTLYNHYYQASINSGENGRSDTTVHPDDVKLYPYLDNGVLVIGPPHAIAITDGGDGIVETEACGDDQIIDIPGGKALTVGDDGKLCGQTQKSSSDVWYWYEYMGQSYHIQPMGGVPFTVIITSDTDGWLNTEPTSDDAVDLPSAYSVTWSQPSVTGIDACAIVCKHEREHQARFEQVRLPVPPGPPYSYTPTLDGDYVDDNYEEVTSGYHLYSGSDDTYNLRDTPLAEGMSGNWSPEQEFCAYMAEMAPGPTYPANDWSDTDGKNWDPAHP